MEIVTICTVLEIFLRDFPKVTRRLLAVLQNLFHHAMDMDKKGKLGSKNTKQKRIMMPSL